MKPEKVICFIGECDTGKIYLFCLYLGSRRSIRSAKFVHVLSREMTSPDFFLEPSWSIRNFPQHAASLGYSLSSRPLNCREILTGQNPSEAS